MGDSGVQNCSNGASNCLICRLRPKRRDDVHYILNHTNVGNVGGSNPLHDMDLFQRFYIYSVSLSSREYLV
jgi:hypothetical protein